jgi:hypothetical protein
MSLLSRLRNSTVLTSDPGEEQPGQGFFNKLSKHLEKAIDTISDRFNIASGVLNMRSLKLLTTGAVFVLTTACGGAAPYTQAGLDAQIENNAPSINKSQEKEMATKLANSMYTSSEGIYHMVADENGNATIKFSVNDRESVFGEDQHSFSGIEQLSDDQKELVRDIMAELQDQTGGKITLEEVDKASEANISITQSAEMFADGNSTLAGFGNPRADIVINADSGADLERFAKLVVHEMGHGVFGLNDLLPNQRKNLDMQDLNLTVDGEEVGGIDQDERTVDNTAMGYGKPDDIFDEDGKVSNAELKKLFNLPFDRAIMDLQIPGDQAGFDARNSKQIEQILEFRKNEEDIADNRATMDREPTVTVASAPSNSPG